MIYAKERPERPLWPRLAPWQDAPEPTPYALGGTQPKDRRESRRVFQRKGKNQDHQLSWWFALRLEGDGTGGPTRALNGLPVAFPPRAAAKAACGFVLL